MMESNVALELVRSDGKIKSIKVAMPIWTSVLPDGRIHAKMPFIGMETWGKDEADLETGIIESIKGFCIISEKFGLGIESELTSLGWQKVNNKAESSIFDAHRLTDDQLIESIIETGETKALEIDLSTYAMAA